MHDEQPTTTRRNAIKAIGTGALGIAGISAVSGRAVAMSSYDSTKPGSNFIDLGSRGLGPGDDLAPYIDSYFESGNQVYIPPGEYHANLSALHGDYSDASLIGDSAGVVVNRPSPETKVEPNISPVGGDVLIENMEVRGEKGQRQSNWRTDPANGATITLRNVNYPDGTVDCSDSQFLYSQGTNGTARIENCYVGGHGNSLVYFDYADDGVHVVIDGCTFENSNTMIRPGRGGATVRNTKFFGDGFVPRWSGDDPTDGNCGGSINRPFRISTPCRIEVENVHWTQTTECSSPGTFMRFKEHTTGYIDGAYLYNETGANPVGGASNADLSVSNLHISGPGDTSVPWPVSGTQMPDQSKEVWTPDGSTSDPGGGSDSYPLDNSPGSDAQGTVLQIIAHEGSGNIDYQFDVKGGDVYRYDAGGSPASSSIGEDNVTATVNDEGVITVRGRTGNGWGDAFDVTGRVTAISPQSLAYDLMWGDSEVQSNDVPLEQPSDDVPPEECTYQGYPRSEWGYDGNEPLEFLAWQNCTQTTSEFQNDTAQGEGTASLIHPDDVGDGGNGGNGDGGDDQAGPGINAGVLLALGLGYAAYRKATGRNR